jgi:hypothetical protein
MYPSDVPQMYPIWTSKSSIWKMRNDSPDRRIDLIYRLLVHEIKLSYDPNSLGSVCEDIFLMSLNKFERVLLKFS